MKRSLSVLLLLLLVSCACMSTCVAYNSLIYRRIAQIGNQGQGVPFNSGYPGSNGSGTQPAFNSGYPGSNGSGTQPALNSGSNGSDAPSPVAFGYPSPLTNPSAQKAVALGYPAPCSLGTAQNKIFTGVLAYTTYDETGLRRNRVPNVKRIGYSYDGNGRKLTLGVGVPIATTPGADGITALPDGNLVVGSEGHEVYLVSPLAGPIKVAPIVGTVESDHVTYDSQRNVIWTSGYAISGSSEGLVEVPLNTFAGAIIRQLKGDDVHATHIAFDASHKAYYTDSPPQGHGSFGVIDLDKFTTARKINNIPAAHGIGFDHFTNTLFLVGANHITQINPVTLTIISDWVAPPQHSQIQLDQAAFDGQGHLFATSNDGNIVFIDYSRTRKIADPTNPQFFQFVENRLDDVALLCVG